MTRRSITKRAAIVTATALVALGTVGTVAATAGPEHAAKPTKKQIAGLFDTWNTALQTGDSDKVADLYAKDAVLLPTVSNEVRTDRAEIVDYFDHFLPNKPVGTKIETIVNVARQQLRDRHRRRTSSRSPTTTPAGSASSRPATRTRTRRSTASGRSSTTTPRRCPRVG